MVRSKPKVKPKKKAPADDETEPTEEAPSVAPTSAFNVEGIEDDKLTIAFEGNVTKVIREDFVTRKR